MAILDALGRFDLVTLEGSNEQPMSRYATCHCASLLDVESPVLLTTAWHSSYLVASLIASLMAMLMRF